MNFTLIFALVMFILSVLLAGCGGGGRASSIPVPQATATAVPASTNLQPIASDPLPTENGQVVNFAVCVPVFDTLVTAPSGNGFLYVGCVSTVTAPGAGVAPTWNINGQSTIPCSLQYDQASQDVIQFQCQGNPYG